MADTSAEVTRKLKRLAAGSLLLVEESATKAIHEAVKEQSERAAAELAARDDGRKSARLALLLPWSKRMAEEVRAKVVFARDEARAEARRRLNAELRVAGMELKPHEWVVNRRGDEDESHAVSAAESLAGQWRSMAMNAVVTAHRQDRDPIHALESLSVTMGNRVSRTATTEVAQAYSDEHRAAAADLVEFDRRYRDGDLADRLGGGLVRQWVAMLDACRYCWPYDGETTPIGQSFADGAEPGFMHPRCRCYDILVPRGS